MARATALIVFLLAFIPLGASAKDSRFWNLTANTITSLQLSPAGKNDWGRNQADNDRDRTVDHDERLKITDTVPGTYDVKFVDKSGRTCVVPNIEVKTGAVFSIAGISARVVDRGETAIGPDDQPESIVDLLAVI